MIRNYRDLSMYKTQSGRRLPEGMFLRSAALTDLKPKDIDFLKQFQPLTVIDLRTDVERKEKPDYPFEAYHAVSLLEDSAVGITHDKESEEAMELALPNMIEMYAKVMESDYCVQQIRQVFQILCDPDRQGAVLWHCTEGKDRCGLISALFLKMMGFDDTVIMEDYLKSMRSNWKKANYYYWMIRIFKKNPAMAAAVKDALSVKREYLEAAFQEIENRYGSFDYFFAEIGVSEPIREEMRQRYLPTENTEMETRYESGK